MSHFFLKLFGLQLLVSVNLAAGNKHNTCTDNQQRTDNIEDRGTNTTSARQNGTCIINDSEVCSSAKAFTF